MLNLGFLSVSFRNLSVDEIIEIACKNRLQGIEWGSDIHVPAGDVKIAESVREKSEKLGLNVFAYGSYYRAGENENPEVAFKPYLQSAIELNAPSIRVWAGKKWSWKADEAYINKVVEDTRIICDMAPEKNIDICYEYHPWSLTDTRFSAIDTVNTVKRDNLKLYWQPNYTLTQADNVLALKMVMPYLKDVHVFYWDCNEKRFPLTSGEREWSEYIDILKQDGKQHNLMLEFFKDNSITQCTDDSETLHNLLK